MHHCLKTYLNFDKHFNSTLRGARSIGLCQWSDNCYKQCFVYSARVLKYNFEKEVWVISFSHFSLSVLRNMIMLCLFHYSGAFSLFFSPAGFPIWTCRLGNRTALDKCVNECGARIIKDINLYRGYWYWFRTWRYRLAAWRLGAVWLGVWLGAQPKSFVCYRALCSV